MRTAAGPREESGRSPLLLLEEKAVSLSVSAMMARQGGGVELRSAVSNFGGWGGGSVLFFGNLF